MLSRRRSAPRQRSRPDGERHPRADIARGLGAGKRAGRPLTHRAERTCNIFACQAAWPRRTNIPPDAGSAVRNIAPTTRPAPLTHDGCLRILASPEHRAIPQNVVIFSNVAEVSQESDCRLASVQFPFAGATATNRGNSPMKKLLFAGAILASFAAIHSASAADLALKAPPPPAPVYSWTGWYVGLNLGGSFGRAGDTTTFGAGPTLLSSTSSRLDGVIGGGQIGYNWQVNNNWLL